MMTNKGTWPRLKVREGFSQQVTPEPRSESTVGEGRVGTGAMPRGREEQGTAGTRCSMCPCPA